MNAADRLVDLYGGDGKVYEQDDGESNAEKLKKCLRVVFVSVVGKGNGHGKSEPARIVNALPEVSFVPAPGPPRMPGSGSV